MPPPPPPPPPPLPPPERPLHTRPGLVLLVGLGGAAGTAVRAAVTALLRVGDDWPWATWAVNVSGAFLLGLLLERLARTGPDDGRRRAGRLLLGTGFLGGYTTYSTFALDTVTLTGSGGPVEALVYAATTMLAGLAAAAVGIAVGTRTGRPRATVGPRSRRVRGPS
jgi:fluoride exporter